MNKSMAKLGGVIGCRPGALLILVCCLTLTFSPANSIAETPQVDFSQIFNPGNLNVGGNIYLTVELLHDPGTLIYVNFYLLNTNGSYVQIGSPNQAYSTIGQTTVSVYVQDTCFSPASGWQVYAEAVGETMFTGANYSGANFSIAQDPPDLEFAPTTSGSLMVIASQTNANATTTQTNLTISDNLYLTAFPANIGCATSVGYQINVNVDGVSPPNGFLQNLGHDNYYPYQLPLTNGVLGAGTHTAVFTIISPTGSTVATTGQNTFFLAAPATIVTQPANQTVNVGAAATFWVAASGDPTPVLQWAFNGSPISGATGSSYTVYNVNTNEAGNYSCTASNYAGSATSSNATLQVVVPPVKPNIKSFTISSAGIPEMVISGQPGSNEVVQSSSDLLHWTPVSTNYNANGTNSVTLPAATNQANFYRVFQ